MEGYERIILASGSPRRRELLAQIGIKTEVIPSWADENTDIADPEKRVEELARRKCVDVARDLPSGIFLGADTVVSIDGVILGKPADTEEAKEMLRKLSGKTHQVYTGVALMQKAAGDVIRKAVFSEKTDVTVAELDEYDIEEYVATGEPMDKAGAYGIQGSFAKFVKRIDGEYSNVVGLPLAAVYARLKKVRDKK
ncbi:MAG TPA: septum formation inhibitor Maf [Candidatus Alectryocaccobium stercorigallinarum]|nr:septum formation inhibitor Maf [Candidatus Alectryocaccobium stercorigallinarum]